MTSILARQEASREARSLRSGDHRGRERHLWGKILAQPSTRYPVALLTWPGCSLPLMFLTRARGLSGWVGCVPALQILMDRHIADIRNRWFSHALRPTTRRHNQICRSSRCPRRGRVASNEQLCSFLVSDHPSLYCTALPADTRRPA